MSISLIILSTLIIALAAVPLVKPRVVYEYPFVVGLFLTAWMLPQAWAVEHDGLAGAFDPTIAWNYMTLSLVFLVAGYILGRLTGTQHAKTNKTEISTMYSERRMTQAAVVLIAVGAVCYPITSRMAATNDYGNGWTGVILIYALLGQCLVFGAALTFLIFLRTKDKVALILFCGATAMFSPVLLFSIKREFIFEFAIIIFGSLFFVKNLVPPRFLLIVGSVIGAFIVNNAGDIRGYVKNNDSSLIGALTSSDFTENASQPKAPEIAGAVSDIAIASETGEYHPFVSIYNGLISRYIPAFVVGRDIKNSITMKTSEDSPLSNRYFTMGATRTGFSDTFRGFWYFGVLCFALVGFLFGAMFNLASAGGLRYQYLYVTMLSTGLHAITHGFDEFVASLPFLLLVIWLPFRYARITRAESRRLMAALRLREQS